MKPIKHNYPGSLSVGEPSTSHLREDDFIDLTVQNDVPTLKEILNRYRNTGEIIAKRQSLNFSEDNIVDTCELNPDIEDLNARYIKAANALSSETFSKKNLKKEEQRPPEGDIEGV